MKSLLTEEIKLHGLRNSGPVFNMNKYLSSLTLNQLFQLYAQPNMSKPFRNKVLKLWISHAPAHMLKSKMNQNTNLNTRQKMEIANAWALRRHSVNSLLNMIKNLKTQRNTEMIRKTIASIQKEINRRSA